MRFAVLGIVLFAAIAALCMASDALPAATGPAVAEAVIDPPGISVSLRNGKLTDLADALGQATGTKFGVKIAHGPGQEIENMWTFTLEARDEPFWKVYQELNEQHPFTIYGDRIHAGGEISFSQAMLGGMSVWKGFDTQLDSVSRESVADPQQPDVVPLDELVFYLEVRADPRLWIVSSLSMQVDSAMDERNVEVIKGPVSKRESYAQYGQVRGSVTAPFPEKHGERMALVKGLSRIRIAEGQAMVELGDVEKKLNNETRVGEAIVSILNLKMTAEGIEVTYAVKAARKGQEDAPAAHLELVDVDGNRVGPMQLVATGPTGWTGTIAGALKSPIRAILRAPSKYAEVAVPFEFHDVPLPK